MAPTQQDLDNAAKLLASSMTPMQASVLVAANYNAGLKQAEDAKKHPLSTFQLADADWQLQKAHLIDGGGVVDDGDLAVEIMTALVSNDQATFWRGLVHLYKFWMKFRGYQVSMPGGGTFWRGVSVP